MANVEGLISAPILGAIAAEVAALLKSDALLRELISKNAPRAYYFDSGTITNAVAQRINEAFSGTGETFYQLVMVFTDAAGAGMYRIDSQVATPTVGLSIPAGGGTLVVTGHDNIRYFSVIAQTATTMPFARYLFK